MWPRSAASAIKVISSVMLSLLSSSSDAMAMVSAPGARESPQTLKSLQTLKKL
jgi:hypothetical protein